MTGDVRVPGDIALIGYDDIDYAAAAVIPLSSVRQPAGLIGSTAVDLLLGADQPPDAHVLFEPELVASWLIGVHASVRACSPEPL